MKTTDDLIDRQAAIGALFAVCGKACDKSKFVYNAPQDEQVILCPEHYCLCTLPSAQPEPQWIPFKTRPLTEEEQDEHPECDCILDCKLPDDGQVILVSINLRGHERVQYDEFYTDDGSYLDSGYAIGAEATAWMPLPEPYKERREE